MTRETSSAAAPLPPEEIESAPEPSPAELTAAGHWAETQVIESIKEATLRRKDPRRVLSGQATQTIGGIFHPVRGGRGRLITPKRSKRSRLRRLLGYLSS
jgi:hypothetical protein